MNDNIVIICILLAISAAVLIGIVWLIDRDRRIRGFTTVALILFMVGVTSWASNRDRQARAEELRAAAVEREPFNVTWRRDVVTIDKGRCWVAVNTRKNTHVQQCGE